MSQLLQFPGSVKRGEAIEVWMRKHADELGAIARRTTYTDMKSPVYEKTR